jgi:hypothetical protein
MKKIIFNLILVLSFVIQSISSYAAMNEDLQKAATAQLTELQLESLKVAVVAKLTENKLNKMRIDKNKINPSNEMIEYMQSGYFLLTILGGATFFVAIVSGSVNNISEEASFKLLLGGGGVVLLGAALIESKWENKINTQAFLKQIVENENYNKEMRVKLAPWATLLNLSPTKFDQLVVAVKNKIAKEFLQLANGTTEQSKQVKDSDLINLKLDIIEIAKDSKIIDIEMAEAAKSIFNFVQISPKTKHVTLKDALSINVQVAEQIHQTMIQIVSSKEFDKLDLDKNHILESLTRLQNLIDASKDFQAAMN